MTRTVTIPMTPENMAKLERIENKSRREGGGYSGFSKTFNDEGTVTVTYNNLGLQGNATDDLFMTEYGYAGSDRSMTRKEGPARNGYKLYR